MNLSLVLSIQSGMVRHGANLNLTPEVQAYISGLTTPLSTSQKIKLDTFVKALKTGLGITALSDAFDVMYILAGETAESSLRNLVKNAHQATAVNSPVFTPFEGFAGNGTSSYIDTEYNPAVSGYTYKLNDASRHIYHRNTINNGAWADGVAEGNSETETRQCTRLLTSSRIFKINSSSSIDSAVYMSGVNGFKSIIRYDSTNISIYMNSNVFNRTQSSTEIISSNQLIFRSSIYYSNDQISFYVMGKSMINADRLVLMNAIEAYMDANGKGVIS